MPTTLPSNFCPAFTVCTGFEAVGEEVKDKVEFSAIVADGREEDGPEAELVVLAIELVVSAVELGSISV
jgi:hypothetical protein